MQRFLITSPTFKGHIEALYDSNGRIFRMDFGKASDLSDEQLRGYKIRIPVIYDHMEEAFKDTKVKWEAADMEVTFQDFMREYPYKRNTHLAEAYWPTMTSSQQYQAFVAAITYRKYCERKKGWYTPMIPVKWLKTGEYKNNWSEL